MKWEPFLGAESPRLPAERRKVLVAIERDNEGRAPSVVVGYLRYAAGDRSSPFFVTPGVDRGQRRVTHFSDCLGDDFEAPGWLSPRRASPRVEFSTVVPTCGMIVSVAYQLGDEPPRCTSPSGHAGRCSTWKPDSTNSRSSDQGAAANQPNGPGLPEDATPPPPARIRCDHPGESRKQEGRWWACGACQRRFWGHMLLTPPTDINGVPT